MEKKNIFQIIIGFLITFLATLSFLIIPAYPKLIVDIPDRYVVATEKPMWLNFTIHHDGLGYLYVTTYVDDIQVNKTVLSPNENKTVSIYVEPNQEYSLRFETSDGENITKKIITTSGGVIYKDAYMDSETDSGTKLIIFGLIVAIAVLMAGGRKW